METASMDSSHIRTADTFPEQQPPTFDAGCRANAITVMIAEHYGVSSIAMFGRKRTYALALARHVAMSLIYRTTRLSLQEIADFYGGRDHTSVLAAVRRIEKQRKSDAKLAHTLREFEVLLLPPGSKLPGRWGQVVARTVQKPVQTRRRVSDICEQVLCNLSGAQMPPAQQEQANAETDGQACARPEPAGAVRNCA